MDHKETPSRSEKGQSLIEFAFGLVVLIILLAGVVDLGRALFTYMALREAVQEGALYGSTDPTNTEAIEARVKNNSNLFQALTSDARNDISIDIEIIGDACAGNGIKVDVSYDNFPVTMPFLGTVLDRQTVSISTSATDTILSPVCP